MYYREELIYSANMHKLKQTEDQQLTECDKENDATLSESQDCNQKGADKYSIFSTLYFNTMAIIL